MMFAQVQQVRLFPDAASTHAEQVDALFFFILGVTLFFTVLIAAVILTFAVKYRRRSEDDRPPHIEGSMRLEIAWSVVPLVIALGIFAWGARIYFAAARPPADAMPFYLVGKQWMWKVEHPSGKREINELHVPRGQAIKLKMTSEDVIHSFFVPAMRVKADVIPGKYTTLWFRPDTVGVYHLFCSQYCGAEHSRMAGRVVVMDPTDYEEWLGGATGTPSSVPSGEDLFAAKACNTCHRADAQGRGPVLDGLFGKTQALQSGGTVTVDEGYIRESILNPSAKVVAGFQPIMPTFQGIVSEEQLLALVEYVRSLGTQTPGENTPVKK